MKKFDIVIIGGGPAGVSAAMSARHSYPEKTIGLIRREKTPMIPCGIPYILFTLKGTDENVLPDKPLDNHNVSIIIDEVVESRDKTLILKSGEEVTYEKLVVATGSKVLLPGIEGGEKEGIFPIKKEKEYLDTLRCAVEEAENIVVLGGGYIGVEVVDELIKAEKNVTIVEKMERLLPCMDEEFGEKVAGLLTGAGATVITGKSIVKILGKTKVSGVELDDGSSISCDLVIISVGYKPNYDIAETLGLAVEEGKGIVVDDYLRASDPDVFAVGDCAATYDFFSGNYSNVMLASTATADGRLAGTNLYSIKVVRQYQGVMGTFSTKILDTAFAASGISEKSAIEKKIEYVVGRAKVVDRHPGKLPGASEMFVKLLFSKYSHTLMGAEIFGGDSVGELINMVSVMILNKMTQMEINTLQVGTHPLLTASPVVYPIITATTDAINGSYR